ncbi:MAG: hypothetical protein OEZ04_02375 [Nitrospinota bacterium]|nr:hypothetical protein [Nitrospinota bacterium]
MTTKEKLISTGYRFSSLATAAIAIALLVAGCNSGSDGGGAKQPPGEFTPGLYSIKIEIADVRCSDGAQERKGYGFKGQIDRKGEFLTLIREGEPAGRGHALADGEFHLSANIEDSGYTLAAALEGSWTADGVSGLSQAIWTTPEGSSCQQISQFTATLTEGS